MATFGGKYKEVNLYVKQNKIIVIDPGHGGSSPGASTPDSGVSEKNLTLITSEKIRNRLLEEGYTVIMTRDDDRFLELQDRADVANDIDADLFLSIHYNSAGSSSANGTEGWYSDYRPNIDLKDVYAKSTTSVPVYDANTNNKLGNMVAGKEYQVIREEDGNVYINFNGSIGIIKSLTYVAINDKTPNQVVLESKQLAASISAGIENLGLTNRGAKDGDLAVTRLTNMPSVLVEVGFLSNKAEYDKIKQDSFQEQLADVIVQSIVDFFNNK